MTHDFNVVLFATTLGLTTLVRGQEPIQPNRERTPIGCVERAAKNRADFFLPHGASEPPPGQNGIGGTTKGEVVYRLRLIIDLKLPGFVGDKVRIVSALEKKPPRSGRPAPPVEPIDERGWGTPQNLGPNVPTFKVRTIQLIAATCPDTRLNASRFALPAVGAKNARLTASEFSWSNTNFDANS